MSCELRIKLLLVFGWLSGCVPVGNRILHKGNFLTNDSSSGLNKRSNQVKRERILEILNIIISCTLFILDTSIYLIIICFNPINVITQSDKLSEQIIYFTSGYAKGGADAVIRIVCCLYYNKILTLAQNLFELNQSLLNSDSTLELDLNVPPQLISHVADERKNKNSLGSRSKLPFSSLDEINRQKVVQFDYCHKNPCLMSIAVVTIVLSALGDFLISTSLNWDGPDFSQVFTLYFVPKSEIGVKIYFQVLDLLPILSLPFALSFLVIFGYHLTSLHGMTLDKLNRLTLRSRREEEFKKVRTICHGDVEEAKNVLAKDFVKLKTCFEEYGRIGGIFSMALLCNCVLSIIGSFNKATLFQSKTNLLDCTSDIAVVILLVRLGNFIKTMIDKHREDCRNKLFCEKTLTSATNQQVQDPFLDWFLSWRWKLTACQVFSIDHDLISAVAVTLMTYFIFMFQLKTSENTSINIK